MADINFSIYNKLSAPVEEAYRVLRTNLQFCAFDKILRTITITSCNPGEGKTTNAINLAVSVAKTGVKVLLVDSDLRKPMIMKHISCSNTMGLSNLIAGYATLDDVVCTTNVENLYYLPCGPKPPNPTELVGSVEFSCFLKKAEEQYDLVIIDTPPLGSVIDCAVIASQTDGTILVIGANEVDYPHAVRVKEQLEKVNAHILGVILNKVDKVEFRDYYNHYNYYGKEKNMDRKWFKNFKKLRKVSIW